MPAKPVAELFDFGLTAERLATLHRDAIEVHIEAALELKIFCEAAVLSMARSVGAGRGLTGLGTYQACRNAALRAATAITDEYAQDFALHQVIRLCTTC